MCSLFTNLYIYNYRCSDYISMNSNRNINENKDGGRGGGVSSYQCVDDNDNTRIIIIMFIDIFL